MADYDPTNLGRAVASLDLDHEFLSKDLESFSVPEKSQLVSGIVDENLKRGRWISIVEMIYKDSSNIGILYDGNRSELEDRILESAQKCPEPFIGETIRTLKDQGKQELLFRLATEVPFDYKILKSLKNSIGDYLSDSEKGEQRTKTLYSALGNTAFKHKNFADALIYFERVGDKEGMGKIFEAAISEEDALSSYSMDFWEEVALVDPAQKGSRLKRLVLTALSKKGERDPWKAFQIFKKYNVSISPKEKSTLYDRATENILASNVKEANDLEFSLLWAKKHTDSDPIEAYKILNRQEPDGEDVLKAAISGIEYKEDSLRREKYGLSLSQISETHLKKILLETKTPFKVRVKIARNLKNEEELKNLSKEAVADKKLDEAYNLWVNGKGDPKDPEMSAIRTKLINKKISSSEYFSLNFKGDSIGAVEYYNSLIKAKNFKEAYEIALDLKDEERTQKTREKILAGDLGEALSFFMSYGVKDEKGIKHVMEKTAETHNVPTELVREIIKKHHPYSEK